MRLDYKGKHLFAFSDTHGMHRKLRYCFKKCVSNKRKKSTDFLDLQEIKTTKTKKV
jgi:hypothetical protein